MRRCVSSRKLKNEEVMSLFMRFLDHGALKRNVFPNTFLIENGLM